MKKYAQHQNANHGLYDHNLFVNTEIMKTLLLLFFSIFFFNSSFSQDSLAICKLIKNTEISIYKAQKEIIAGNSPSKPLELSTAIYNQVKAVNEFKKLNYSAAAYYSIKARQYSNQILSDINLVGLEAYLLNDEEKNIQESSTYGESYNSKSEVQLGIIGDSILLDPNKLSEYFKITL